jgi:glycine cleavage system H protein
VLADDPAKVNADPEGEGWFFKLKLADKSEFAKLMTAEQYAEFVKGL